MPAGIVEGNLQHRRESLRWRKGEYVPRCLLKPQETHFIEAGNLFHGPRWLCHRSQRSIVALENVCIDVPHSSHGGSDLDVDVRGVPEGESWAVRNEPPTDRAENTFRTYSVSVGKPGTDIEFFRLLARLRGPPHAVDGLPILRGVDVILEVVGVIHAIPLALATPVLVHHVRSYLVE